jgi:4'-phosphopantetheinyl transferase EntD
VIEELLPGVAVAETFEDVLDEPLYPEEEAAISRAVDKRRNEFRTVRACARRALRDVGVVRPPLVPGNRGAPTWPSGIVGSMTHCAGYRAAAVARAERVVSLGIDAEPDLPLPGGVLEAVALPEEIDQLEALARAGPGTPWDRLLFSAKESVYKTWFPLTERWLGFEEALVRLDQDGTFTATLLVPGPLVDGQHVSTFPGRWTMNRGLVLTSILLPARSSARAPGFATGSG